jgi:UDP-3-O-[3-hydroxymyristoyl] glucosamine N-acyltransferase
METDEMDLSVSELLPLVEGDLLSGDKKARIRGFASLKEAGPGDLAFFYDARYHKQLRETSASVVLVPKDAADLPDKVTCVGVNDPSKAFETVVEAYGLQPAPFKPGIHPTAVIGSDVQMDRDKVSIAACVVIGDRTVIGDGVSIGANTTVASDVRIGVDCVLHPNVSVYPGSVIGNRVILHSGAVIGADGFGYVFEDGRHRKIRQAGIVQIDDDVEVGAGTTIDRARFGRTWIGEGTKIDNQVQIGHNVRLGKHCILVSQTGIAGSSILEDYVICAAQSGVSGHLTVGQGATLAARAGVLNDLPGGKTYMGFPAIPMQEEQRHKVYIRRLPKIVARIQELEAKLADLEDKASDQA